MEKLPAAPVSLCQQADTQYAEYDGYDLRPQYQHLTITNRYVSSSACRQTSPLHICISLLPSLTFVIDTLVRDPIYTLYAVRLSRANLYF